MVSVYNLVFIYYYNRAQNFLLFIMWPKSDVCYNAGSDVFVYLDYILAQESAQNVAPSIKTQLINFLVLCLIGQDKLYF